MIAFTQIVSKIYEKDETKGEQRVSGYGFGIEDLGFIEFFNFINKHRETVKKITGGLDSENEITCDKIFALADAWTEYATKHKLTESSSQGELNAVLDIFLDDEVQDNEAYMSVVSYMCVIVGEVIKLELGVPVSSGDINDYEYILMIPAPDDEVTAEVEARIQDEAYARKVLAPYVSELDLLGDRAYNGEERVYHFDLVYYDNEFGIFYDVADIV